MKVIKILKITFAVAFLLQGFGMVILIGAPVDAQAALFKLNPDPIDFQPQIGIPDSDFENTMVSGGTYDPKTGKTNSDLLAKYIQAFYNYGLAAVGILAAIVLMAGGVLWLTSAGNDTKISQAKELITGSIVGAAILFGSYIILNTVNPELLKLKTITLQEIGKKEFKANCDPIKGLSSASTAFSCTDGSSGQPGAIIPISKCPENTTCTKTDLNCYDFDLGKQVNRYACLDVSKYICCEYEPHWFYKRKCVTKYLADGCPTLSGEATGNQKLKISYPKAVCNIDETTADNKIPCYSP